MTGTLPPTRTADLRGPVPAQRPAAPPRTLPGTGRVEFVSPITGEDLSR